MFTIINQILFLIYLFILSIMDLKRKEVHIYVLLSGFLFVFLRMIFGTGSGIILLITGGMIGAFFLLISKLSSQSFGYGDSILITIMGCFLDLWDALNVLLIAFGLAAVFSMAVVLKRKYDRKYAFPFIPFLTVAYAGVMVF